MKCQNVLFEFRFKLFSIMFLIWSLTLSAQNSNQVSGTVTDSGGLPIPGVTILEKGTKNGTITNIDGKYSISVLPGAILSYTFVGMLSKEVTIKEEKTVNVSLTSDLVGLDEVVIVGYGAQKKVNLTGAVSSIGKDELTERPITNLSSGLSGLASGVFVSQNSGGTAGGDGGTIRIRGVGTMNNSNPLIVVDGIASDNTDIMNDIDPNDIESISILKDAASASIYGSRGANGVILITTKRGASGKSILTYNSYYGWQNITSSPDYISDFALYMATANRIRGVQTFSANEIQAWKDNPNDPLKHPNVNWYDELYGGTSSILNHNLSYSGGTEKTQYRFSLSYLDQDGITPGNSLQRYGVRTNLSSEVLKGLKMGGNVFFRWSEETPNVFNNIDAGWSPSIPIIQHPDGRWGGPQSTAVGTDNNTYAFIANRITNESNRKLLGDIFAEWEIISGLKATAKVSLDYNQGMYEQFLKRFTVWNFNTNMPVGEQQLATGRTGTKSTNQDYQLNTNFLLSYSKSFSNHNFDILGGFEKLQFRSDNLGVTRQQFPNNEVQGLNAGLVLTSGNGSYVEHNMLSYFGRLNYNYDNKYLFEANFRADGSSRFKNGNQWGYFPSFSVGWNMKNEEFMNSVEWLNVLKLRASWGQLGNNRIGDYAYQPTYTLNQNYSFNGVVNSGIAQTSLTDENISWEETTTTDIGIDAAFFNNKLTLTADYFIRQTDGILTGLPIPQFLGAKDNPTVNLASMENKGFEILVGYKGNIGDLKYNVSVNFTQVDNKVTDYLEEITTGGTQIGYPFNSFFGYEAIGIFKTQEQLDNAATHRSNTGLGDLELKDQITVDTDGDGIPDAGNGIIGSEDRVIIGNPIPKYTYGANLGLQYKGFDFSLLLQGAAKRDKNTYDAGITPMNWADHGVIPQRWFDEEWSVQNPNGTLPKMDLATRELNTAISTFWVKDVSYLRVKNIQLGYDLSKFVIKSNIISKFRLYLSGENVLTFSNEEWGFDPETNDNLTVPNVRTISFGVSVGF